MTNSPFQLAAETRREWLDQSEVWLRAVDPHGLVDTPIYLLDVAEVSSVVKFGNAVAVMSGLLSLSLKPYLELTGRWTGPGFCCVVNVDRKRNLQDLDCCIIHEYAHWLDSAAGFSRPILEAIADCHNMLAATAEEPVEVGFTNLDDEVPWLHHSPRFIRAVCHLSYRAGRESNDVWNSNLYWLSRASEYAKHLDGEPERLADQPLVELLRQSPPDAFIQFASADLERAEARYRFWKSLRPANPAAVVVNNSRRNNGDSEMNIIQRIREKQTARKAKRFASFNDLVATIADGKEPSAEVVEQVLEATGRDLDALEAAVSKTQTRRRLQTQLADLDAIPGKIDRLNSQMKEHDTVFAAARKKHNAAVTPFFREKQQLENQLHQRHGILKQLKQLAPAECVAQAASLDDRARPIVKELDRLKDIRCDAPSGRALRVADEQIAPLEVELKEINDERNAVHNAVLTS